MTIDEVFPNPTVDRVIFQIRFPSLFGIEAMVGEYQFRIVERFPESKLFFTRKLVLTNIRPELQSGDSAPTLGEPVSEDASGRGANKLWQFESDTGVVLRVEDSSLSVTSTTHKTYNNPDEANRFRDMIQFALDNFFDVSPIKIPKLNRIGLRYVDKCPVLSKDNDTFLGYYNTTFPLERFTLDSAQELQFIALVERDGKHVRFVERFEGRSAELKLILDFDGFALNVKTDDYLVTTDQLHQLIADEYEASIKEPLREHMRRPKEEL
jgi:uncharacterized protein (TIGR04255 family)